MTTDTDQLLRDSRDAVKLWLGIASTLIWFALAYTVSVALGFGATAYEHPSRIIMTGFAMLGVAALPWLAYRPLVARSYRKRMDQRARRETTGQSRA